MAEQDAPTASQSRRYTSSACSGAPGQPPRCFPGRTRQSIPPHPPPTCSRTTGARSTSARAISQSAPPLYRSWYQRGTHAVVDVLEDERVEERAGLGGADRERLREAHARERGAHIVDVGLEYSGAGVPDGAVRVRCAVRIQVAEATPRGSASAARENGRRVLEHELRRDEA